MACADWIGAPRGVLDALTRLRRPVHGSTVDPLCTELVCADHGCPSRSDGASCTGVSMSLYRDTGKHAMAAGEATTVANPGTVVSAIPETTKHT